MTEIVSLPDSPDIPDLTFRYFRDEKDFEALVAVIEACQQHDHVDPLSSEAGLPSVEELSASFSSADNIDLSKDMLLVNRGEQVIGFQWVRWWEQADGTRIYYHRGRVIPEWREHGIGTATLHWAEDRIREIVRAHGSQNRAIFQANTTRHEGPYNELLLTEGYEPVHTFVEMAFDHSRSLPAKSLPQGFEIRPALPEHYRAIWEANEEAFEEEWGHRRTTDEDYVIFLGDIVSDPGFDPSLWQIAWHGDEIAGVALSKITERGVGEISELSVRKQWRGQGLGRALLSHALHALVERGLENIRVFTDIDSVRDLYESVGFRVLTEYIRYQKPVDTVS